MRPLSGIGPPCRGPGLQTGTACGPNPSCPSTSKAWCGPWSPGWTSTGSLWSPSLAAETHWMMDPARWVAGWRKSKTATFGNMHDKNIYLIMIITLSHIVLLSHNMQICLQICKPSTRQNNIWIIYSKSLITSISYSIYFFKTYLCSSAEYTSIYSTPFKNDYYAGVYWQLLPWVVPFHKCLLVKRMGGEIADWRDINWMALMQYWLCDDATKTKPSKAAQEGNFATEPEAHVNDPPACFDVKTAKC